MKIILNSVEKVKAFVNEVSTFDADIDLVSSRFVIDAKSIMGILSLDLTKPIEVDIHDHDLKPYVEQRIAKYA